MIGGMCSHATTELMGATVGLPCSCYVARARAPICLGLLGLVVSRNAKATRSTRRSELRAPPSLTQSAPEYFAARALPAGLSNGSSWWALQARQTFRRVVRRQTV